MLDPPWSRKGLSWDFGRVHVWWRHKYNGYLARLPEHFRSPRWVPDGRDSSRRSSSFGTCNIDHRPRVLRRPRGGRRRPRGRRGPCRSWWVHRGRSGCHLYEAFAETQEETKVSLRPEVNEIRDKKARTKVKKIRKSGRRSEKMTAHS